MKSVFGYANDLICVDSIHLICLAREVLQLERRFLTQSKRRGVSKQMLSSPEDASAVFASPSAAAHSPKGGFFFCRTRFAGGDAHLTLSASQGAAETWSSLKWRGKTFVIYCCFINPFRLFSNPCLGLGPFGVACKTPPEVECLPKFSSEEFFNSPQGINDSFSHGEPSSSCLQLLSFVCVSKQEQHILVNKSPF